MKNNNEEYEIVGINHKEYQKQMEEQALKSKSYIKFKAFIGGDMDNPAASMEMSNASAFQMITIMAVLKDTLEELIRQYPELYAEVLSTDIDVQSYDVFPENDEENIDGIK